MSLIFYWADAGRTGVNTSDGRSIPADPANADYAGLLASGVSIQDRFAGCSDGQYTDGNFQRFTYLSRSGARIEADLSDAMQFELETQSDIAAPPLADEQALQCDNIDAWRDGPRGIGGSLEIDLDGDGPGSAVAFKIRDLDPLRDAADAVEARIAAWESEAAHAQQIGAEPPAEPSRTISWILADNSLIDLSLADVQTARIALIAERERIILQARAWKDAILACEDIDEVKTTMVSILAQIEGGG